MSENCEYGFIYFLSNPVMQGIFKIGFTRNHPKERVKQLSAATACPIPFTLYAAFGCENPSEVEAEIHKKFERKRVNRSREFFKLKYSNIMEVIEEYSDEFDDLMMVGSLHPDVHYEQVEDEERFRIDYFFQQCADPIFWPEKLDFD